MPWWGQRTPGTDYPEPLSCRGEAEELACQVMEVVVVGRHPYQVMVVGHHPCQVREVAEEAYPDHQAVAVVVEFQAKAEVVGVHQTPQVVVEEEVGTG